MADCTNPCTNRARRASRTALTPALTTPPRTVDVSAGRGGVCNTPSALTPRQPSTINYILAAQCGRPVATLTRHGDLFDVTVSLLVRRHEAEERCGCALRIRAEQAMS